MHWRRKWHPLQCSCLESPRDGGVWGTAIYGATQSHTRLKWLSSNSSRNDNTFHVYDISHYSRHFCVYRFIWFSWERVSADEDSDTQCISVTVPRPHELLEDRDLEDMSPEQLPCFCSFSWWEQAVEWGIPLFALVPGNLFWKNYIWAFWGNIYLFICLSWVLVAAHRIFSLHCSMQGLSLQPVNFSCSMWDIVAWPGIDPWAPWIGSVEC